MKISFTPCFLEGPSQPSQNPYEEENLALFWTESGDIKSRVSIVTWEIFLTVFKKEIRKRFLIWSYNFAEAAI